MGCIGMNLEIRYNKRYIISQNIDIHITRQMDILDHYINDSQRLYIYIYIIGL